MNFVLRYFQWGNPDFTAKRFYITAHGWRELGECLPGVKIKRANPAAHAHQVNMVTTQRGTRGWRRPRSATRHSRSYPTSECGRPRLRITLILLCYKTSWIVSFGT